MAVIEIKKDNFQTEVLDYEGICLVDFWATWCPPCRMLSPIVDEVAEEMTEIKVCKINVDEEQELAVKYGVSNIPTLIVMKNGEEVKRSVGAIPKAEIVAMLKS